MSDITKLFIYGDVHAPYHDKRAVACMLKAMKGFKPDMVIDLGDFFDCYSVSSYKKDPQRWRRLMDELNEAEPVLRAVEAAAGKAELLRLEGNHEARLETHLQQPHNRSLHGAVSVGKIVDVSKWKCVGYEEYAKVGKVIYTHDLGFCGKYALMQSLNEAAHSVVIGHTHVMSSWVEGDLRGRHRIASSFGWLGDTKKADYMHTAKKARHWCHGFGIGYMEADGTTWFTGVPIINGKCRVEGKAYAG